MATERYEKKGRVEPEDHLYFNIYADYILERVHGDVLDLGCGEGWLTKLIANKPEVEKVVALDKFSSQPEENEDPKIHYIEYNITNGVIGVKYDVVTSTEFIEHITREQLEELLQEIRASLKPNGIFIGSTPNKLVETKNPYHLQEYTIDELTELFSKYDLVGEVGILGRKDLMVWEVSCKSQ